MPEKRKEKWFGLGKEWRKEIKTYNKHEKKRELREKFYGERTILRLKEIFLKDLSEEEKMELDADETIAKLKEKDVLTSDAIIRNNSWQEKNIGKGRVLSAILKDFFVKKCDSKNPVADTFVALKYLKELGNVDFIRIGETVEIKDGFLEIKNTRGKIRARASLLPQEVSVIKEEVTAEPELVPLVSTGGEAVDAKTKEATTSRLQTISRHLTIAESTPVVLVTHAGRYAVIPPDMLLVKINVPASVIEAPKIRVDVKRPELGPRIWEPMKDFYYLYNTKNPPDDQILKTFVENTSEWAEGKSKTGKPPHDILIETDPAFLDNILGQTKQTGQ